jgi:hypothetical protein
MNFLNSQSEDTLSFLANPSEGFSEVIFAESPPEIVYRTSYGNSFYGFKTRSGEGHETANPEEAILNCEIYIDHLRIDGEILINSPTLLTEIDEIPLSLLNYRDEGYGLGPVFITDALSNLSFLSNRGIKFYTGSDRVILKIEKQTRMLLVIRDSWDLGGSLSWSIVHNYDNLNRTYEAYGADFSNLTEQQLLALDKNGMVEWIDVSAPETSESSSGGIMMTLEDTLEIVNSIV